MFLHRSHQVAFANCAKVSSESLEYAPCRSAINALMYLLPLALLLVFYGLTVLGAEWERCSLPTDASATPAGLACAAMRETVLDEKLEQALTAPLQDVVRLTMALMSVDTSTGKERQASFFLARFLMLEGMDVWLQCVTGATACGQVNVYGDFFGEGPISGHSKPPKVLLCSHTDAVPPHVMPQLERDGDENTWLTGRGSNDAKGQVAAMTLAALQAHRDLGLRVGLLFVSDEEVTHTGMKTANDKLFATNFPFMVMGEPTKRELISKQKGMLKVLLEATGRSAHSGYPEYGKCAITPLVETLADLTRQRWPVDALGETTMNIGLIEGGTAANIVPEYATAQVMFRLVGSPEPILERTCQIAEKHGVEVTVISSNEPVEYFRLPQDLYEVGVVSYNTDTGYGTFFDRALLFGAGSILTAHTANERVLVRDLEHLVKDHIKIIQMLYETLHDEL
ncbi:putative carboxypeptidase [Porphyridium purpureum]|uniref:Putative carboxypeptidase n=1 Tax=Porphyridium purpureum TaxID=35688 RepID=A0A5J4YJX1_PORPP|nr:putative carboxypeptidase [Porphyridium purpureum]|eukprot:POR1592..scf297_16